VQKAQYGKTETKRAITNVLDKILPAYRYASLPELNAVLRPYNILADRGKEGSRTYNNNGLVYRVLDDQGRKVGTPVKASDIYNKPTLKFLTEKFAQNHEAKQRFKQRARNVIDASFIRQPGQNFHDFIKYLQKEEIQLVIRQNEQGRIYGITYVDHKTKCVHNGSDLGKPYSANQIQERCRHIPTQKPRQAMVQQPKLNPSPSQQQPHSTVPGLKGFKEMMEDVSRAEYESPLASEWREDERRRKRKRLRH
jgi:hypothetical protein